MIYFSNCISFRCCCCWCRCVCVGWLIVLAVLFSLLFSFTQSDLLQFNKSFSTALRKFCFLHLFIYFFLRVKNVLPPSRKEKSFDLPHMAWLLVKKNVQWPVCMRKMWEIYCLTTVSLSILTQRKEISKIGKNDKVSANFSSYHGSTNNNNNNNASYLPLWSLKSINYILTLNGRNGRKLKEFFTLLYSHNTRLLYSLLTPLPLDLIYVPLMNQIKRIARTRRWNFLLM